MELIYNDVYINSNGQLRDSFDSIETIKGVCNAGTD